MIVIKKIIKILPFVNFVVFSSFFFEIAGRIDEIGIIVLTFFAISISTFLFYITD